MSSRDLVLAPVFGAPSSVVSRSLAQLRELGVEAVSVDLRSGVRRHAEVSTAEIGPLASRLAASAAHLLAGDAEVRVGFLGAGSLAVVAAAAGAASSRTEAMVALFPDRAPLVAGVAPSLVVADARPGELGQLQAAWGPAAQVVLAPSGDVAGVVDPVSQLVADFAARELQGVAVPGGLVSWMHRRGLVGQFPLTELERARLVARLERELLAQLRASGRMAPGQAGRVGRVAAMLGGLAAAQLGALAAPAAAAPVASPVIDFSSTIGGFWNLDVELPDGVTALAIECDDEDILVDGAVVTAGSAASPVSVSCDEVLSVAINGTSSDVVLDLDLDLDLDGFGTLDKVDVRGGTGNDVIDLVVDGAGLVEVHGSDGADTIRVADLAAEAGEDLQLRIWGESGDDVLAVGDLSAADGGAISLSVGGSSGSDTIVVGDLAGSGYLYLNLTGSVGSDDILVGDADMDGASPQLQIGVFGSSSDDAIRVATDLGIHVVGSENASVTVTVWGSEGHDVLAIGDIEVVASSSTATLGLSVTGGLGSDEIVVGDLRVVGTQADVSVAVNGSSSSDTITIGDVFVSGDYEDDYSLSVGGGNGDDFIRVATGSGVEVRDPSANGDSAWLSVYVYGSSGDDDIALGPVRLGSGSAGGYVQVTGSDGDDVLHVGTFEVDATHSSGGSMTISGGSGDNLIVLEGIDVGPSASATVLIYGSSSTDTVRIGGEDPNVPGAGVRVAADGRLDLAVDLGSGDDVLQLLGPLVNLGTITPTSASHPLFVGGSESSADTMSFVASYGTWLGITDVATFTGNSMVAEFESYRLLAAPVVVPPPGPGPAPAPAEDPVDPVIRPVLGADGSFERVTVPAGGTVSTAPAGQTVATPVKKAIVNVTLPGGGSVKLGEVGYAPAGVAPAGKAGVDPSLKGGEFGSIMIDLDIQREGDGPASIEVLLDKSMFTPGADVSKMAVMLDGELVPICPAAGPVPATCIRSLGSGEGDDVRIVIETTHNSVLSFAVTPTDRSAAFCQVHDDGGARFGDLSRDGAHVMAMECLADAGVFNGVAADRFDPAGELTRAQVASVLVRVADALGVTLPAGEAASFGDVSGEGVHDANIARLAGAGIVAGFADGSFGGGREVTRAQFAAMATRLFELATGVTPNGLDAFSDDDGLFAEAAMDRAAALGVLEGVDGLGRPADAISRAQAASMIARLAGRLTAAIG